MKIGCKKSGMSEKFEIRKVTVKILILKPDAKKLVVGEKILNQKSDGKNFNFKTRCVKLGYGWKSAVLNGCEKL